MLILVSTRNLIMRLNNEAGVTRFVHWTQVFWQVLVLSLSKRDLVWKSACEIKPVSAQISES